MFFFLVISNKENDIRAAYRSVRCQSNICLIELILVIWKTQIYPRSFRVASETPLGLNIEFFIKAFSVKFNDTELLRYLSIVL